MAIFHFINWIVASETIEGGNYSMEETIRGNTVDRNFNKNFEIDNWTIFTFVWMCDPEFQF